MSISWNNSAFMSLLVSIGCAIYVLELDETCWIDYSNPIELATSFALELLLTDLANPRLKQ